MKQKNEDYLKPLVCNKCNKELKNNIHGSIIHIDKVIWKRKNTFTVDWGNMYLSYTLCNKCTKDLEKYLERN